MPVESIIASMHSDFGFCVASAAGKEWWNGDPKSGMPTKKADWATLLPKGRPTVVEYYVTQKGAKRITKVVSASLPDANIHTAAPVSNANPVPNTTDSTTVRTQYGRPLSAYEAEKDIRIHVSGILQAVITAPALVSGGTFNYETFTTIVKELTIEMLDFAQSEITKRKEYAA